MLFSGPMVRAILSDAKTQTRRVVSARHESLYECDGSALYRDVRHGDPVPVPCPYGSPGDEIWVRETWAHDAPSIDDLRASVEDVIQSDSDISRGPYYRADCAHEMSGLRWRPSIHMPRWVCRLRLRVTSVRVEQLHDISEADAMAEGVGPLGVDEDDYTHVAKFRALWESIYGARFPWASNPLVWVLGFERIGGAK